MMASSRLDDGGISAETNGVSEGGGSDGRGIILLLCGDDGSWKEG